MAGSDAGIIAFIYSAASFVYTYISIYSVCPASSTTNQQTPFPTPTIPNMAENVPRGTLTTLDPSKPHAFAVPSKRINEGEDVQTWLTTFAYTEIMTFLLQLNAAMFPLKISGSPTIQSWELESEDAVTSPTVSSLRSMVTKLQAMIDEAPPDPGPRRFGNMSFRKWYQIVEDRVDELLELHVPEQVLKFGGGERKSEEDAVTPKEELKKYLLGSFGSAQRLDYGTGHELSFLAFLGCIWKLGGFSTKSDPWGAEERGIVLGVIEPYVVTIFKSSKMLITKQVSPPHPQTNPNIHSRTGWFPRRLGSRRPLLSSLHLRFSSTFARNLNTSRHPLRRLSPKRSKIRRRSEVNDHRPRAKKEHVLLSNRFHLRRQTRSVLGTLSNSI